MDNPEKNAAYRGKLKPGEWTPVRDQEAEAKDRVAFLYNDIDGKGLSAGVFNDPLCWEYTAPVLILKVKAAPDA